MPSIRVQDRNLFLSMRKSANASFLVDLLAPVLAWLRDRPGRSPVAKSKIKVSKSLLLGGLVFLCALNSPAQRTIKAATHLAPLKILILSGDRKPECRDITE